MFTNQLAIALGAAFPIQVYSDPSQNTTNHATISNIVAISVDPFGVITVTTSTPHGIDANQGVGANVLIAGVLNPGYNMVGPTIQIVNATQFKVRNLIAAGLAASSGGTVTTTTIPVISNFTTAYPVWATGVTYLEGDIVVPTGAGNGHFYKCIQGGISAAAQPAFPLGSGARVPENSPSQVIWQEAGLTNTTAPPPPGAEHLIVFAGSLWAWNTSPLNTPNGLDGPTCLRMSDSNNLNSWNPVNQAFIDKDDGTTGSGISAFTITGFGIPPEGSLVAFKQFSGYQIVGVFGSPNFLIQRIKSDLGCTAPRTIQFATGFGLIRFSHLGFALFDGINDRVLDEEVHPYIFPVTDIDTSDITTVDFNAVPLGWAAQTAHPPMYVCALPVGVSGGKLTRIFCFDMVLKSWAIVDLPFAISTIYQARVSVAVSTTVLGTFDDGGIHRWQSNDLTWDNSIDTPGPSKVNWSVESPMVFNPEAQGGRLYCRQLVVRGLLSAPDTTINISLKLQGESPVPSVGNQYVPGKDSAFSIFAPVDAAVTNLDAIINGQGAVQLDSFAFHLQLEDATVPPVLA